MNELKTCLKGFITIALCSGLIYVLATYEWALIGLFGIVLLGAFICVCYAVGSYIENLIGEASTDSVDK